MMEKYNINYLEQLEADSIYIIRETYAEFKNPVLLYSIGKDSSVMLRLAQKAFYPNTIPFPLLHIDTGYKFSEMIEFRDYYTSKVGVDLLVYKNKEPQALQFGPESAHTDEYIYYKKTKALLDAIKKYGFDAAIGGSRREEEKSRAKERIFSVRSDTSNWDPKNQRPELWHIYNGMLNENQTMRIFPLADWTEVDIWAYIKKENIEVVPLYFAKQREILVRNGIYIRIDEFNQPTENDEVINPMCRYRTLGCSPSTGAVLSSATTVDEIISEVINAKSSERENRAIDSTSDSAMEDKKKEGYF